MSDQDPDILTLVRAGSARIERVDLDGRTLWIKRPETLTWRMRLQKGDPTEAFAAEVAAHRALFARGLPAAPIVASGEDFLVTEDCGPTLKTIAHQDPAALSDALSAAATTLAQLHLQGASHGRPSLKDICWQNGRITFLDFERAGRDRNAQSMDVLVLIFSTAVETRSAKAAMACARDAYVLAGGGDIWKMARRRARRWRPLSLILWPVAKLLRGNREFDAIGPFFRFMRERGPIS